MILSSLLPGLSVHCKGEGELGIVWGIRTAGMVYLDLTSVQLPFELHR